MDDSRCAFRISRTQHQNPHGNQHGAKRAECEDPVEPLDGLIRRARNPGQRPRNRATHAKVCNLHPGGGLLPPQFSLDKESSGIASP